MHRWATDGCIRANEVEPHDLRLKCHRLLLRHRFAFDAPIFLKEDRRDFTRIPQHLSYCIAAHFENLLLLTGVKLNHGGRGLLFDSVDISR